ncbi:cellulase family glycosylhydrolase [Streptomyces spiramenti]|uniref:Cellulase family glycosylhydrolase n=1 Tax=Streptomyces spiramenti TaxID=2720606 RepID=A0ABX1AUG7_9ACTN|nr:cellulase family glycosylhydrolase [Streptomyces spiramenti]NJP67925.1 cellulase family glycosylhydrolase [Streptomyces spiramenti]
MHRALAHLRTAEGPATWLGANYWSRAGGPLMWRDYDAGVVDSELRTLRDHGLTMTRSFFYWPDFHPEPDRVDEEKCRHFSDFLDRHHRHGLVTVPTFLVGHMSGENWDPPWRGGRDLYRDVWLVARQAWFVRETTRRFAHHPAVAAWLISNEMPLYGSPPGEPEADREAVAAWAQLMVDAVRAGGGRQPVSLGDGAWGLENTGRDNGFRLRDTARLCDFLGPHVYRMEDDAVRRHHSAAWVCELTTGFGRPVVLEEFGLTGAFASEEDSARYYRQLLHTSLLAGATGWVAWNNTDYDALYEQPPYRHHAFEMRFGITDAAGAPKAPLRELRDFAAVVEAVELSRCTRAETDTALVVSSYLDTVHPFTREEDREHVARTARQSWIAARLADAPPAVVRESDGLPGTARLYLVPSVKQLLAPTWHRLRELAESGATVYVSYSAGSHEEQRGPWYPDLDSLFGVRHGLEYGLVDPIEDPEVELVLTTGLGGLPAGHRLRFTATHGTDSGRVRLPVRPVDAEVLAEDAHGRPALMRRRVGAGSLVLCVYPLEYLAACTPRVNPDASVTLYGALAAEAGVRRPVTVADPRVAVDRLVHEAGHEYVWLVSQAPDDLTVRPELHDHRALTTLDGTPVETVTLPGHGVAVLRSEVG